MPPSGKTDGHEVETKQNVKKQSEHGGMHPAAPHTVAMIPTSSFADRFGHSSDASSLG